MTLHPFHRYSMYTKLLIPEDQRMLPFSDPLSFSPSSRCAFNVVTVTLTKVKNITVYEHRSVVNMKQLAMEMSSQQLHMLNKYFHKQCSKYRVFASIHAMSPLISRFIDYVLPCHRPHHVFWPLFICT